MRWLKKLLTVVLVYIAVYLPFVVLMQALTGYDFTGAYAAVTGVGAVELIVGGVIKVAEAKRKKDGDDGSEESAYHPPEDVP
jgi:multidrug transporter EmrE-like cation transporter